MFGQIAFRGSKSLFLRSFSSESSGLLRNKVVIVTGAASGVGKGIAQVCHREGANVVIADIQTAKAESVAKELLNSRKNADNKPSAISVYCDLRDDNNMKQLVDKTVSSFGRVDGLVNNAGVNFVKPFLQTLPEDWDKVISVDLRAVFFLSQLVCKQVLAQKSSGSIVNISSVHSQAALPGAGPYDAAKWGVVGLSKSIAVELATEKIRVNCVSPGLINTEIWQDLQKAAPNPQQCLDYWNSNIPINRVIEPQEIGEITAFLLSERASSITGANIFADGGMTSLLVSKEPFKSKSIEAK